MAQFAAPEDTFRTHLGADGKQSAAMLQALNASAWNEWQPQQGFPYQAGSGYGDLNDQIIAAPNAQYNTYQSIGYGSNTAMVASKTSGKPAWLLALQYWWKGSN